ncbi:Sua5/YciO/YrdC/YwlC family protein [Candidatus Woesearchaeota archaeon]|nr:Sua5/YciO/YrdC/YwlC family protein [Candidatus Woesearchaeota archaeon]
MEIINRQEISLRKHEFFERIMNGSIFIHPTDTIYGLGCTATNDDAVIKLRKLKQRASMPFSVIAPSKKWIMENCIVSKKGEGWLRELPGPFTLLLKLSNPMAVSNEVNLSSDTLGVRLPRHWFGKVVEAVGVPVVTTSANVSGADFMTSIDDLDSRIALGVDFAVYEGEKKGKPSTIINLINEDVKIIER